MNASTHDIAAVVLAGGRGRRLGGRDKGLVTLAGRPLVTWVTECLAPQVGDLVISANRNIDAYSALRYTVVTDPGNDFSGPLAGVLAASHGLASPWLLVAPCDTPFLPADLASRLRCVAEQGNRGLARAADAARTHYAIFLMHRRLVADIATYLAAGGRRLQDWQARHAPAEAVFAAERDVFLNVNSDDDLRRAEALAKLR